MKHFSILLAGLVSSAVPALAASIDTSKLPPPSTMQGVTYAKDIRPLFEASCLRCHGPERPKAGLRLDSLEGVLKGSKDGKVITPGSSEKSHLVIAVSQLDPELAMPPKPKPPRGKRGPDGSMTSATNTPPARDHSGQGGPGGPGRPKGPPPKPLTAEQVGLVRAWIDQGAK